MSVTFAKGFSAAGVAAGISSVEGKKDLALVVNQGPLDCAAVASPRASCGAPPLGWPLRAPPACHIKAVILNSGGANACTGQAGYEQSAATAKKVAELVGTQPDEIAVCSTGLIGELLPLDHVLSGVESAYAALSDDDQAGSDASHAIMTTDTKPKTVSLEGDGYRIGGMVKGSGMIAPQLATMLCVITTDAAVGAGQLQAALNAAVDHSFNRIDVDGCMSTNDTVLLLASGASGVEPDPDEFNALVAKIARKKPLGDLKKTIKAKDGVTDSTGIGYNRFDGTEEVLQLNKIENDTENLKKLASKDQEKCTYLKSPAGIFTEVTLPIEDIMKGHEKDTLNTATISFPRLNNADEDNPYNFATPSTILMVQKDSLQSFFEKSKLADSRTSYTTSYSNTGTYKNAYPFQNIANLVSAMYKNKGKSENWNKVVLVPVTLTTSTQNNATVITKINHDMQLTSTRLIKATDDPDKDYTTDEKTGKKVASGPIRIKVIYSKFKEE